MIGKGNLHAHGGKLAIYMADSGHGELIDKRGFLSDDLHEAFCTIQAIAESQTHCEKPFFHTYVRLPAGENLTTEQWLDVADRFERALGFDDQPRAVVMHTDPAGDRHIHIAWSRIEAERMDAIDPGLYKRKMVQVCRALEIEYGLQIVPSERKAEQLTRAPARPEFDGARRLGVDIESIRETIRACYDRSDNGSSFVAALNEHGLGLARGDSRDFVVIDSEGGPHALGKRICGVTAAEIRKRLGASFKDQLPSVAEVKTEMAMGATARRDGKGWETMDELTEERLSGQSRREADQLQQLAEQDKRLQEFKRQREAEAEEARRKEQERRQADERRAADGDIASAKDRYAEALGQHYDIRDPYASLARASMAEYGAFKRQQEELRQEIAKTKDPEEREALQLRQRIEGCEYMAVTSQRLAGISATIAGREDSPAAVKDRDDATTWQEFADQFREKRAQQLEQRAERQAEQQRRSDETDRSTHEQTERQSQKRDRQDERTDNQGEISEAKAAKLAKLEKTGAAYQRHDAGRQPSRSRGGRE